MKNTHLPTPTLTGILMAVCLMFSSCGEKEDAQTTGQSSTASQTEGPLKLVFIPFDDMDKTRLGGRALPNTIYWTNTTNTPADGPRVVDTRQGPCIELQGLQSNPTNKDATVVTMYQIVPVPKDARQANVSLVLSTKYNEWVDKAPRRNKSGVAVTFLKEGMESLANNINTERNRPPKEVRQTIQVPIESEHLCLKIQADNASTIQIFDINVEFQ